MGTKTAAQIAAGWRASARGLREQAGTSAATSAKLHRAQADQLDECARELMTDLHIAPPASRS